MLSGAFVDPLGDIDEDLIDGEEYTAEELEALEEQVVDEATAARTIEELDAELAELRDLTHFARQVRAAGTDRKWSELSSILQAQVLATDSAGRPRKLIIFTEHRDTLEYLRERITPLLGRLGAVEAIHGGVRRVSGDASPEFTKNPDYQILLANCCREGLNLQAPT